MNEFKRKLNILKKIKNISVFSVIILIFVYIGVEPLVRENPVFRYLLYLLVLAGIAVVFIYESKYASAEKFIEETELQINDAGYYITARTETDTDSFKKEVLASLKSYGFKTQENIYTNELQFDFTAVKGVEYVYCVKLDTVNRNDIIAYLDASERDIMADKLRRKGECAVFFICNRADEGAKALSKSFTKIFVSRYNMIFISPVIIEVDTKRVYFLGNRISRTQKIVSRFALDCEVPIDKKLIGNERLEFQKKLEKDMDNFSLSDFRKGNYNER